MKLPIKDLLKQAIQSQFDEADLAEARVLVLDIEGSVADLTVNYGNGIVRSECIVFEVVPHERTYDTWFTLSPDAIQGALAVGEEAGVSTVTYAIVSEQGDRIVLFPITPKPLAYELTPGEKPDPFSGSVGGCIFSQDEAGEEYRTYAAYQTYLYVTE